MRRAACGAAITPTYRSMAIVSLRVYISVSKQTRRLHSEQSARLLPA
ncbi:hypothetical protein E5Q_00703 [Mixia osmundae IAM 14324]|uniref:Uncharacterized protein n=1 Tax=Mixia osmundae (strain CBS 9802 / IAM 14324 / JCM 22182 / KY 12970) TaxID=764103 RepID=G7DTZ6_MIXOS|nr:hypothetical protein E5Q_00703 [Mixia osmundae IAM 14324]